MTSPFIVAELSANHLGSFDRARELVRIAAFAGANAVKVQTFDPDQMADQDTVIQSGPWAGRKLHELYQQCCTPRTWHKVLFDDAREHGIEAFASVFHPDDVDFLEREVNCPRYKIASFELNDHALIAHAAQTRKPLILSTGMATLEEILAATDAAWTNGCTDLTVLKCTSAYPARIDEANLVTIRTLQRYVQRVGLSDHTPGYVAPVVATALGATLIEKHLCKLRADGGPDAAFSMEPREFGQMVEACRMAAEALGTMTFGPTESEAHSLPLRRVSGGKRGERIPALS